VIVLFLSAISSCEKSLIADKTTNGITLSEKTVMQPVEISQGPVFNKPHVNEDIPPLLSPIPGLSESTSKGKVKEKIENE